MLLHLKRYLPLPKLYKFSIVFAYLLLIIGISFGSTDIKSFWEKRGISEIQYQIDYLFSDCEPIVHRGPLLYAAMMANCQTQEKTNRGLYKDCLHAIYMPYCAAFFSRDLHFMELKNEEPSELWGRIIDVEEFCIELFENILPQIQSEIQ